MADPKIYELDLMGEEGAETQKYLSELTGQGTVPNVRNDDLGATFGLLSVYLHYFQLTPSIPDLHWAQAHRRVGRPGKLARDGRSGASCYKVSHLSLVAQSSRRAADLIPHVIRPQHYHPSRPQAQNLLRNSDEFPDMSY